MTIELTTAFNLGDIADGQYTHVKIISFTVDLMKEALVIDTLFGTEVDGVFTAGIEVPRATRKRFMIKGNDYAELIGAVTSEADAPIYNEVAAQLYGWLVDNGHFAGEVV